MKTKFEVLIIGAGNIGAFADFPTSRQILTHAHAFSLINSFKLIGFVSHNKKKTLQAAKRWHCEAFSDLKSVYLNHQPAIITVATPDNTHYPILLEIAQLEKPPRLVLAEKPLTLTSAEAAVILRLYKQKKIELVVNFARRFLQEYQLLHQKIKTGKFGQFVGGTGYYGKGLVHNGIHLIDLLRYYLGEIKKVEKITQVSDFSLTDPSVSALLKFGSQNFFWLQAVDSRLYTTFEIDLYFTKGKVRLVDSGLYLEEYQVIEHPIFRNSFHLQLTKKNKTSLAKAIYFTVKNIQKHLEKKEPIISSGHSAYQTLLNCEIIKKA